MARWVRVVGRSDDERGERRARGLAICREVYAPDGPLWSGESSELFDLLVVGHPSADLRSRRAHSIPARRRPTIGLLPANDRHEIVALPIARALEADELTPARVRQVVSPEIEWGAWSHGSFAPFPFPMGHGRWRVRGGRSPS